MVTVIPLVLARPDLVPVDPVVFIHYGAIVVVEDVEVEVEEEVELDVEVEVEVELEVDEVVEVDVLVEDVDVEDDVVVQVNWSADSLPNSAIIIVRL